MLFIQTVIVSVLYSKLHSFGQYFYTAQETLTWFSSGWPLKHIVMVASNSGYIDLHDCVGALLSIMSAAAIILFIMIAKFSRWLDGAGIKFDMMVMYNYTFTTILIL